MDDVVKYMTERRWTVDQKAKRTRYLLRLAQESKKDPDIASKIGGMLIYNQIIEQYLADIVEMSIYYIKAEVWPVSVGLEVELDKATFGQMIGFFKQFATIEPKREIILSHLHKYNQKRNQVVHDLFDIPDLTNLTSELDKYALLADEIIALLEEYDDQICENFNGLARRIDFFSISEA